MLGRRSIKIIMFSLHYIECIKVRPLNTQFVRTKFPNDFEVAHWKCWGDSHLLARLLPLSTSVLPTGAPVETRSSACLINSLIPVDVHFLPLLLEMVESQSKRVRCPVLCVLRTVLQKSRTNAVSERRVKEAKSCSFHLWSPIVSASLHSKRKQLFWVN